MTLPTLWVNFSEKSLYVNSECEICGKVKTEQKEFTKLEEQH